MIYHIFFILEEAKVLYGTEVFIGLLHFWVTFSTSIYIICYYWGVCGRTLLLCYSLNMVHLFSFGNMEVRSETQFCCLNWIVIRKWEGERVKGKKKDFPISGCNAKCVFPGDDADFSLLFLLRKISSHKTIQKVPFLHLVLRKKNMHRAKIVYSNVSTNVFIHIMCLYCMYSSRAGVPKLTC